MQIKIFTVSVFASERSEDELNRFLRSHRILQVERHFCPDNGGYWAFLVEYMDGEPDAAPANRRDRRNPAEDLSDEERRRFDAFKQVRRDLAVKLALPAYMIFTDKELATLARVPQLNDDTLSELKGIQPSRLRDYVKHFYGVADGEAGGQPDAEDSRQGQSA